MTRHTGLFIAMVAMAVVAGLAPAAAGAQQPPPAPTAAAVPADPADVASPDAIVAALYDVISGPAGQARNWNRFRSLFAPGARLIPTGRRADGTTSMRTLDVEGYITGPGPNLETNGFFEREIGRRSERFGNVLHAFSAYESKRKAEDAKPFARGINSIQLYTDGTRWWLVTILWDSERPDNPIPGKYIPGERP
jgi:hypothetical protein